MLEGLLRIVQFVLQGARTNYFGWGCPVYCVEPSWAGIILTFLVGLFSGFALASIIGWLLWTSLDPSSVSSVTAPAAAQPSPINRYSALAGYVNAQQHQRRRQR